MGSIQSILLVGTGGFLGAISRYGVGLLIAGRTFPLPTLLVNASGCLAMGFLANYLKDTGNSPFALFFGIGFLGAFTTFSAFSLETIELLRTGHTRLAAANVAISLVLCLAAIVAGYRIADFAR